VAVVAVLEAVAPMQQAQQAAMVEAGRLCLEPPTQVAVAAALTLVELLG
jgi:hypothetical protein